MTRPSLWLIVGVNGAGKTTFYERFLAHLQIPFINADRIALEMNPDDPGSVAHEAAEKAMAKRTEMLDMGASFCTETVFSHPSKIALIEDARSRGYDIRMIFVHVSNVAINKARVAYRVQGGGHRVPEDKIISRHPRTIDNVRKALPLVHETWVFDNSSADASHRFVLRFREGLLRDRAERVPQWAEEMFELGENRV